MEKKVILANVASLTAEQLFDEIKGGNVTLKELQNSGFFPISDPKYKQILKWQEEFAAKDTAAWERARYGNEMMIIDYIANFPMGNHVLEAKQRIDFLQNERKRADAEKHKILNNLRLNPNSYPPSKIIEFLQNGISESELMDCDIPKSAIDNLTNIQTPNLQIGQTPESIPEGYTEVYFWGYTGSGKTCALGAILQMAEQHGYLNIATGPGYLYANQLKNIFSDDDVANDYLPGQSPVETTQYLPFTLKRPEERNTRSVSLIELSGEIFKCFFLKNAGQELPTQSHVNTFDSLNTYLKDSNRKIHFFFIDYNRENRPDGNGITQSDYLAAAATYFKNNEVFGKTTDAIFVVLTKSDLLVDENNNFVAQERRLEYAKKYLADNNYKSFIETLKAICKKYDINAGKLTIEPFSLGKVYFQQICNFEGSAATRIVEILMERISPSRKSILDIFNK